MIVLQIEHLVPDYNGWKKAFDSDPVNRERSGVKRYRIFRQVNNPNFVILELEFDSLVEAESLSGALQKLWKQVEGKVMISPQARIVEIVESKEY
jgi:ribosomal protein L35AE/L33A